jgi:hypothetical protein
MPGGGFGVYSGAMTVDVGQIAADVVPHIGTACAAYGMATLEKVRDATVDQASDATVRLGHRLLRRILGRDESRAAIAAAVTDVAAGEPDSDAALRLQLRKAFRADPELAREVVAMLPATVVGQVASGPRSIAIGTNTGVASTGDHVVIHPR